MIDSEDHFETSRTGGIEEECKTGAACACNGAALDPEDVCNFSLLHFGLFEYFGNGDDVVDWMRQYNSNTGFSSGIVIDSLTL